MSIRFPSRMLALSAIGLLFFAVGCGGTESEPMGSVEGKVTSGNMPVTKVNVQFQSKNTGKAAAAAVNAEGVYSISSLSADEYTVTVAPINEAPPAGAGPAPPPQKPRTDVPQKYQTTATSGLSTKIAASKNTFDIDLKP